MTTVVDPTGTPIPVYNRSGTTIVAVNGGISGAPTPIPHVSERTVALVTSTSGNDQVELPASAEVGDVVEVYPVAGGPSGNANLPSGDSFLSYGGVTSIAINGGIFFRKVSSTEWVVNRTS